MEKVEQQISGIIEHPCIVAFSDTPLHLGLPDGLQLLCGVVQKDYMSRLEPGMQFRSSPITDITSDLVQTANSLYQLEGNIDYVTLPFTYLRQVLDLIDPREIRALIDAGITEFNGTDE